MTKWFLNEVSIYTLKGYLFRKWFESISLEIFSKACIQGQIIDEIYKGCFIVMLKVFEKIYLMFKKLL